MKKRDCVMLFIAMLFCVAVPVRSDVMDTFDTNNPAWVTDRYNPASFGSAFFDGDNRLKMDLNSSGSAANRPGAYSSSFYNTQGKQIDTGVAPGPWSMSVDLYWDARIPILNSLSVQDVGSQYALIAGLWARTGSIGTEVGADYPIFNYKYFDDANPFSGNNATFAWRVWDADAGGYQTLSTVMPTVSQWFNLEIQGSSTGYQYFLNNALVYTDTTAINPESLTTGYLQGYNFGRRDYSLYFDNFEAKGASVPDGGMTALLLGASMFGLVAFKRKSGDTSLSAG